MLKSDDEKDAKSVEDEILEMLNDWQKIKKE
jgi:hypothetical protein